LQKYPGEFEESDEDVIVDVENEDDHEVETDYSTVQRDREVFSVEESDEEVDREVFSVEESDEEPVLDGNEDGDEDEEDVIDCDENDKNGDFFH
jgi:hypothetical protein